ncbi:MAG: TonB-dependent receptor [Prevotellaceae bacterium]|nr:TonB-dependent receptor [Prevotellaceae bacterium]
MKHISFVLLLCLLSVCSFAQQSVTVRGTVTDVEKNPLVGATVQVVGGISGVITDLDGHYSLQVKQGQSLLFSYVGYEEQTISVNGRTTIDVVLKEGQQLEEVVVIGYGTVKKSHLTGAVSSVSAKDLQANVQRSAASALQGRVPGVTVSTTTGQPGQGMSINVRGISSMSSTSPLYVIDGVYGDINMVDPADIQSIEVLKDASAAAIYGSRAANGVVIVTTKGGRKEQSARVTVDAYVGVQTVAKKLEVMDGNQFRDFAAQYNIAQTITKNGQSVPNTELTQWQGKGTDWQDEVFKQALLSKVNINISGGGKTSTYNVSGSWTKQDGIMKTTGYESWNLRTKNTFSFFNDHVRLGNTFTMRMSKMSYDELETNGLVMTLPLQSVYDDKNPYYGHWSMTPDWGKAAGNPVGSLEANDNQRHTIDLMLNGWAEVDLFLKGLKYKLNVGVNKSTNRDYNAVEAYYFSKQAQNDRTSQHDATGWQNQWMVENTLHYDNNFGKHSLNVLLGYSAQRTDYRGFGVKGYELPEGFHVIDLADKKALEGDGNAWQESLVSMFARAMYSYDDRYMASVSIRRDGSSKFANGHRWGNFPSFSLGWNVMNESFFAPLKRTINELKIRGGYGVLGNTNGIGRYATQATVETGMNGVFGNTWYTKGAITGYAWTSPLNTTWEKTKSMNIGLDLGLFNNKLSLTADYFVQKTTDMLLDIPQPTSFGLAGNPTLNAGNVQNKGFEFGVTHRNRVGDFDYHVGVNASFIKNELTKVTIGSRTEWGGYNPNGGGTITYSKLGYPIGGFWLIQTDGIFQSQAEIDAYTKDGVKIQEKAVPGDLKFVDANGDGKINEDDKEYRGSALPKMTMGVNLGMNWKGIDLNLFFDGQFGHKIYNAVAYYSLKQEGVTNYLLSERDAWRPDHTNTTIPRYTNMASDDPSSKNDNNGNNWAYTDRWLENGNFLRLKTLELGYTLPQQWTLKGGLQRIRVYTAMENLFTLTKYSGYTPDLGVNEGTGVSGSNAGNIMTRGTDGGRYPLARSFSFGLQVTF